MADELVPMREVSRALARWRRFGDADALVRAFDLLVVREDGDRRVALVMLLELVSR